MPISAAGCPGSPTLKLVPPYVLPGSGRDKLRRVGRVAMKAHPPGSVDREAVIRSRIAV